MISDLDLINNSSNVKAHEKPMRRRSSLDYIRPPNVAYCGIALLMIVGLDLGV